MEAVGRFIMNNFVIRSIAATSRNKRDFYKPNEDFYINDEENKIFIVVDGVTRNHEEYVVGKGSAAEKVSRIFADDVYKNLLKKVSPDLADNEILNVMFECIKDGNLKIKEYNDSRTISEWQFYPATVGIVATILNNKLYYAYVGDCLGFLFRNNTRVLFAEQQTKHLNFYKKQMTKKERYKDNCNNINSKLAFGLLNGEETAIDMLRMSYIELKAEDTIVLSSDGLENFFFLERPENIIGLKETEILKKSEIYDVNPYSQYADDKTFIMISVQ